MKTDEKKLVVFFSHAGENYNVGHIEKGNTHIIADMIANETGADIFEIVPEKGYPEDDYNECIEIAKKELQDGSLRFYPWENLGTMMDAPLLFLIWVYLNEKIIERRSVFLY